MARKRKSRRNSKKWTWKAFADSTLSATYFVLKVVPFAVLIFGTGAIFLGVREALYADPHLSIQRIVVEPSDGLAGPQRERLETTLIGKNIFSADIRSVAEHLEKDPGIEKARVIKQMPAQLKIEISRRKPLAYIRFSENGPFFGLISEDGVILELSSEKQVTGMIIEAFSIGVKDPSIGYKVQVRSFNEAVKFLKAYQDHPLSRYETITKVVLDHFGNVTVRLGDGPDIRLGRRPLERIGSLEKVVPLLEGEGRQKVDYVDLQFDNVIVKQKQR